MLLKNYFQLLSDISQLYEAADGITFSTPIKNLSGETITISYDPYHQYASMPIAFPNTFQNCIIGSSNDPGSFDDYCLKSQITDFSTSFVTTVPSEIKEGYEKFIIPIGGRVTVDCTVREIGLTKKLRDSSGNLQECLMVRHVLNTPIELHAGDNLGIAISYET